MACRKPPTRNQYCGKAKSKKRRHRRRRGKGRKSCRPGKVTRNPFFNYLRWFRKKHCGWNMIKVAVEGAKCWCKMSDQNRRKFYKEACSAPKMRRRRSSRRSRGRSRCGGRRHSRKRRRKSRSRSRSSACGSWGGRSRSRRRRKSKGGCRSACLRKRRVRKVC
ncbi:hypothetical protein MTP99_017586 [Tenebrio molitor]|jgi:hypothetical protein|nr:hypothetical protein MTP99_017586 [Tenebrio molitor]CAH1376217.1 unnamed protein product [Tenebrio molitor]